MAFKLYFSIPVVLYEETLTILFSFYAAEDSHPAIGERLQKAEITDDDITAQALLFFFGGFETSATLMCLTSYELAVNPDIQDRLREEIDSTFQKYNGKLTYEALMGMKYLDMVVSGIEILL